MGPLLYVRKLCTKTRIATVTLIAMFYDSNTIIKKISIILSHLFYNSVLLLLFQIIIFIIDAFFIIIIFFIIFYFINLLLLLLLLFYNNIHKMQDIPRTATFIIW
jgi:hypothetical protein